MDICAAGRSSPVDADGQWTVIVDTGEQEVVQQFTARNSRGLSGQRHMEDVPHGLRIGFINREKGWKRDERIVYDDNYDDTNATRFFSMDANGITDKEHIFKWGRFHLAQILLRREIWTFEVDAEYLAAARGSRVEVSHDVLVVGQLAARIKAVATDASNRVTGITLDDTVNMLSGKSYGVSIRTTRQPPNRTLHVGVTTNAGLQTELTFDFAQDADSGITAGQLVTFGESGKEVIDGLVTGVSPRGTLGAILTVLPFSSPGVYRADTDLIPPFDSKVSDLPGQRAVTIERVTSDESVMVLQGGVLTPRIVIEVMPINEPGVRMDVQLRPHDTEEPYFNAEIVNQTPEAVTISGVEEGKSYDLRVRWRDPQAILPGAWTEEIGHTVVGQSTNPPALAGVTVHDLRDGNLLVEWEPIAVIDVRVGGSIDFRHTRDTVPDWATATVIGDSLPGTARSTVLPKAGWRDLPGQSYGRLGPGQSDVAEFTEDLDRAGKRDGSRSRRPAGRALHHVDESERRRLLARRGLRRHHGPAHDAGRESSRRHFRVARNPRVNGLPDPGTTDRRLR